MTGRGDPLVAALAEVVGPRHVLTDPDVLGSYTTDWTGRWRGTARLAVRPGLTREVVDVVRACAAADAPLVPQGGNTGLVGGSVPMAGEVVLSLSRLTSLEPVDSAAGAVTAGAGVTLAGLQRHVGEVGLEVPIDFAARESATLGGVVATNAGGERVARHGVTRAQLRGVEAVLADGSVLTRLAGLVKDNVGYDLPGLLCGSEGTLAVLTRVRLRLVPRPAHRVVSLVAVPTVAVAVRVATALRADVPGLEAAELVPAEGMALVRRRTGLPAPVAQDAPAYVLVEHAGSTDPTDAVVEALAGLPGVLDAAVATDPAGRAGLWRYREVLTDAVGAEGVPVKLDVAVPVAALHELVDRMPAVVAGVVPGARLWSWGHLLEGNLHVNVIGAGERADGLTDAVLRLVAGLDGTISAEHGVGRAKIRWVELCRGPGDLAAMAAVKRALDPAGLLNPGVLLPPAPPPRPPDPPPEPPPGKVAAY